MPHFFAGGPNFCRSETTRAAMLHAPRLHTGRVEFNTS